MNVFKRFAAALIVPVLCLAAFLAQNDRSAEAEQMAAKPVHPLKMPHPQKEVVQFPVLGKEDLFSEDHTADVVAIESVFSAYTFANDSHNGPLAASLFTDDAIIHFVWNNHGTLVPTFGINPKQTPDGPLGEG